MGPSPHGFVSVCVRAMRSLHACAAGASVASGPHALPGGSCGAGPGCQPAEAAADLARKRAALAAPSVAACIAAGAACMAAAAALGDCGCALASARARAALSPCAQLPSFATCSGCPFPLSLASCNPCPPICLVLQLLPTNVHMGSIQHSIRPNCGSRRGQRGKSTGHWLAGRQAGKMISHSLLSCYRSLLSCWGSQFA